MVPAKKKNVLVATLFVSALCLGFVLRAERDILKFLLETQRTIERIDALAALPSIPKGTKVKSNSVKEWLSYEARMEQFNRRLRSIEDSSLTTTDTALLTAESPFGNLTTELFRVSWDQPFTRCFPAEHLPHPLVYVENHPAHSINARGKEPFRNGTDPISTCSGPQFTEIVVQENGQRMFSLDCPDGSGKWGKALVEVEGSSGGKPWPENTEMLEMPKQAPGVDWVYTSCKRNNDTRETNLQIQPYRVESLETTPEEAPQRASIVLLIVDSISLPLVERDLPRTKDLLQSSDFKSITYTFNRTSVAGQNSPPNVAAMLEKPNLFGIARKHKVVTSAFEDYCRDHALCTRYPHSEHRVCQQLLCNYKNDMTQLYDQNPQPGCKHGEFFLNHHLRYIQSHWKVYDKERKFHVAKPYGCHMPHHNRYMCNSNDGPLTDFLKAFVPANPNTAVIIASDHGFHWARLQGGFNDHIAGEYEHRNPFLTMILPWASNNELIRNNTERLVSHRDLHATILGLLAPSEKPSRSAGLNLLQQAVPEHRSCRDAQIPTAWCNCFRPRKSKTEARVLTDKGIG